MKCEQVHYRDSEAMNCFVITTGIFFSLRKHRKLVDGNFYWPFDVVAKRSTMPPLGRLSLSLDIISVNPYVRYIFVAPFCDSLGIQTL